jgi:tetratricopeptide (TPR) repeat protein
MEFIPLMKLGRRPVGFGESDRAATLKEERLIALSSWMMILGTIRAVCTFADLASVFLNSARLESVSWSMLSGFFDENQPFLAIGVAWPLLLGIILRRTRWLELVPAAGVTFLFLSTTGFLEAIAEWKHATGQIITIGSFHLTRLAFVQPTASDVILGILGACQLVVECAVGMRCLWFIRQLRRSGNQVHESSKSEGTRRARLGRLAIYASIGFLVLMIRLPVWSTYLEILNESRMVRELVLKANIGSPNRPRRVRKMTRDERRVSEMQQMLGAAFGALRSQNYLAAKETYLDLLARADTVSENNRPQGFDSLVANAENDLAWLLATCPKTDVRDSRLAVEHARAALEIEPTTGNYWNTLGVALYRNGELDTASDALYRSMKLRGNGGDPFDWFFLAMIDHKQGRNDEAREWYEKAAKWYLSQQSVNDEELFRFQTEAAELLGFPKPTEQPRALRPPTAMPGILPGRLPARLMTPLKPVRPSRATATSDAEE